MQVLVIPVSYFWSPFFCCNVLTVARDSESNTCDEPRLWLHCEFEKLNIHNNALILEISCSRRRQENCKQAGLNIDLAFQLVSLKYMLCSNPAKYPYLLLLLWRRPLSRLLSHFLTSMTTTIGFDHRFSGKLWLWQLRAQIDRCYWIWLPMILLTVSLIPFPLKIW